VSLVGVVLAAGASRRMGRPKALVGIRGESFVAHGVRHLWTMCDVVFVVLGSGANGIRSSIEDEFQRLVRLGKLHDEIQAARRHGANGLEVRFVVHRAWRQGMFSSARAGLTAAVALNPEAVLLLPVDHPTVRARTVQALGASVQEALGAYQGTKAQRARFAYAVVPRFRRHRGHPLALSQGLVRQILADRAASDLSDAVRRNARLVGYLDCPDPGVIRNRNTPTS
jgi:CTP:molybdopterin cytidylyltransferase MocA